MHTDSMRALLWQNLDKRLQCWSLLEHTTQFQKNKQIHGDIKQIIENWRAASCATVPMKGEVGVGDGGMPSAEITGERRPRRQLRAPVEGTHPGVKLARILGLDDDQLFVQPPKKAGDV